MKKKGKKKRALVAVLVIFLILGVVIGAFVYNMNVPKNLGVKVSKERMIVL
ncbi:MAG: hypothetical protein GX166_10980 [Clostridiaceae bacterium]|nr:hypothetical protein [Clostridiaceae bacterium]